MDVVKICEVVDGCEDCPKYGDDCDGDKMTEHTDYIRRADAINVIRDECWECNNMFNDDLYMKILALPSAELPKGELISRADAIETVRGLSALVEDEDFSYFEDALNALPSADAVEVVRCEDCKHHEKFLFDDSKLICWVHNIDIVVSPTDYCSYAERRAESEAEE